MLGYVYVKTGKILYTILMHILLNGVSSLIVLASPGGASEAPLLLSAAAILLLVGVIAGIILFFVKRKMLQFDSDMPDAIPRGEVFRTAYLNPGVILYVSFCVLMIVLALLNIRFV